MKKTTLTILIFLFFSHLFYAADSWIRINQLGYLPHSVKRAVFLSRTPVNIESFSVHDALTGEQLYLFHTIENKGTFYDYHNTCVLDFSTLTTSGAYYLKAGQAISPTVYINNTIYNGTAGFLLNYMRQQRCGYNPCLDALCHQHDGYEVYGEHPAVHKKVDVRGGWHDASDYLQYGTTSANAVFQMLFAYQMNPGAFGDEYDAAGRPGPNGIPDILDEARWGLDWLLKMYPEKEVLYHQIADDRDHASFRLPSGDNVDYGWGEGLGRPVYRATGKPQGLMDNQNRSTGIASIAGKYSSAFALGAQLLQDYYPDYTDTLKTKALQAYEYGTENPGVCQTAPCKSPYFYEEDNWVDDMELAAVQLYHLTKDRNYLSEALGYGRLEPVTPWMITDTARHYQWYPFLNTGHYLLASSAGQEDSREFINYLREGIQLVQSRANQNPFNMGVPFIWCSNNLVTAMATQCRLYRELTNDTTYIQMEAALTDWLFGCNPWGTSMIVGLPGYGDYPSDPHSALWHNYGIQTWGGLVDGPVYAGIYNSLWGVHLTKEDPYATFQSAWAVYHDDYADYSTNEPTMDGTASLTYLLSAKETEGKGAVVKEDKNIYAEGGIIRTNPDKKQITVIFSGHEYADGYEVISKTLKKHDIPAAFFFTGDFYRNPAFQSMIKELKNEGYYLGAHSDKHILYCSWQNRDSLLINKDEFISDLRNNYLEMAKHNIKKAEAPFFLPPYEWYNATISAWCKELGVQVISFTPGTYSNADYTTPGMKNYRSSKEIYRLIMKKEKEQGLNGNILFFHIGTDNSRTDKFYPQLDKLFKELKKKGYSFVTLTSPIPLNTQTPKGALKTGNNNK